MAMSLEDLIGTVVDLAKKGQAQGAQRYDQARDDKLWADKLTRISDTNKQKDVNYNAREERDKAMTLAGMQYGPGGSIDRTNQRYVDAANIGLTGHKYTADKGLEGQQVRAETDIRGQDKTLAGQAMQFGPGGSSDRRDALQYQKLTPEAQRAQHAADMAGRLAATGAPPEQVKALYESLVTRPADFSELNPNRQQPATGQTPYVFRDGSVEKMVGDQQPSTLRQMSTMQSNAQPPMASPPQAERQPGFWDAMNHSNEQLGGKLFDPLGLNKKKKSTNPLFPNYAQ